MITVIATIFVFGIIVLIHELGHFITAKLAGMRVDEFAIGFGSKIWSGKHGETVYSLRAVPLGGFNKIAGMTEEEAKEEHVPLNRAFIYKPLWSRFIVIAAGAAMNFLLAIIIFAAVFVVQGVTTVNEGPIVGSVMSNATISAKVLQEGDRIISIQDQPVNKWSDISPIMQALPSETAKIEVMREGKKEVFQITPGKEGDRIVIGILPQIITKEVNIGEAFLLSFERSYLILKDMWSALARLVSGGDVAGELAGPVGIAQMAGNVAKTGVWNLLLFTAILSLNLGLINLLPVPVLDGGHLIFILLEAIRGKKLPDEFLYRIQMVGLALLIGVFIWATGNDILRFLK